MALEHVVKDNRRTTIKLSWLLMVLVLLLAWGLFLVGLNKESLWYDEWISWTFSQMSSPFALIRATPNRAHPPIYYLWLWTWVRLIGSDTVFVMRLTAAIPALLTVALVYRLAANWFRSSWAGIGAAAFLARSGIFIYYARELRMYALVALWATLSWYLLGASNAANAGHGWRMRPVWSAWATPIIISP